MKVREPKTFWRTNAITPLSRTSVRALVYRSPMPFRSALHRIDPDTRRSSGLRLHGLNPHLCALKHGAMARGQFCPAALPNFQRL